MESRRTLVSLRWGDQDPYGHVNNVAIVRLLEEARVRGIWDASDGILPPLDCTEATRVLVSQIEIRYRTVLDYGPDPVEVELEVKRIGGGSFAIGYRITTRDSAGIERSHAEATTTMVFVDLAGSVIRISSAQRAYLRSWMPESS
ncbi:acyl-CoA thioesterase [Naasia lichenicola]|uniref:Acyl-CoA thioesterase n=1 Tax=Naasia lichenicola TaxID=2565933 RepID=A0A4S4FDW3_9MICO|nr:acyl-CoA thioesterase [Naasia lichenicola]THG28158.1 acyl-CoA thioesterase [Naasia lichenicola]